MPILYLTRSTAIWMVSIFLGKKSAWVQTVQILLPLYTYPDMQVCTSRDVLHHVPLTGINEPERKVTKRRNKHSKATIATAIGAPENFVHKGHVNGNNIDTVNFSEKGTMHSDTSAITPIHTIDLAEGGIALQSATSCQSMLVELLVLFYWGCILFIVCGDAEYGCLETTHCMRPTPSYG